ALEAERAGYDAFVIGHFQEPGLLQIRGAVDIPVIGLGEASLLTALTMAGRHCLAARVAGVRALQMDLPRFMRAFTDESTYTEVRGEFIEQVRPLVAAGAEVILPAGGLPMLLFARECPFVIDGALVLNGIAVTVKATEMMLGLRALTGAVVSRRGTYAKASPACIEEYLRARW